MEVMPGYKQTEVGVIPEDWHMTLLDSLAKRGSGHTPSKRYPEYWNGSVKWISLADSQNLDQGYINDTFATITQLGIANSSAVIYPPETVVLSRDAGVGKSAIMGREMAVSQHFIAWTCGAGLSNQFLYHTLQARKAEFERIANGSTIKTIGLPYFQDLLILTPPIEEQHAIATALSDMDALLDGLDRLIAKKRAIKQATMQQLLTGQTRLPGFSGEWEETRLEDHLTFLKNGVNSRAELSCSDDVRYLHYGDIHGSSQVMLNPASVEMPCLPRAKASRLDRLQNGDLIFADASEDMDGVGKSVEIQNVTGIELVSGLHTIAIRFDKSVLADGFKAYIQFIPKFRAHLRQLAAGTKVYATNRTHIASAELRLPGIDEQQAISALLTDMDTEITALETRRAKTRALKQAMMQELLTGRTRLVMPDAKPVGEEAAQTEGRKANVHFLRSVLAAEIIDQLHDQPTFGHVKFEKMMFLAEHLCQVDTGSIYHRKAAGPYDNRALRSIDSQLQKQQWFEARKQEGRYQYVPLAKRGGHKPYFERHFSGIGETLEKILSAFKTAKTEQCEIVATLLAAWSDLLREKGTVSDEMIVHEVLHNWHEAKQRIPEDRWLAALGWMREKGFVPKGATLP